MLKKNGKITPMIRFPKTKIKRAVIDAVGTAFYIILIVSLIFSLRNFPKIECWISTACPRMVDDQDLYNKPIVNVEELAL